MNRENLILIFLLIMAIFASSQTSEFDLIENARLEAQKDAIEQLGKLIENISVTNEVTIKKIISKNKDIHRSFQRFLQTSREIENLIYYSEGIFEVTLEISFDELEKWLFIVSGHKLQIIIKNKVFQAVGKASFKAQKDEKSSKITTKKIGNIWDKVSAKEKAMAIRAAQVDAYRNLEIGSAHV